MTAGCNSSSCLARNSSSCVARNCTNLACNRNRGNCLAPNRNRRLARIRTKHLARKLTGHLEPAAWQGIDNIANRRQRWAGYAGCGHAVARLFEGRGRVGTLRDAIASGQQLEAQQGIANARRLSGAAGHGSLGELQQGVDFSEGLAARAQSSSSST
eukprot:scaffold60418_cov56-Phaeocystis_antarctica.AAC.6